MLVFKGPRIHQGSGFASAGIGGHCDDLEEISLSSDWLLHRPGDPQNPLFRISATFPEEWRSLGHLKMGLSESSLTFDFWIFRDLSSEETQELQQLFLASQKSRLIIAANHLMNWQDFCHDPCWDHLTREQRLLVSFLPSENELGPFLQPQEILNALRSLKKPLPLLVPHFPGKNPSAFYRTLSREDYLRQISSEKPKLIQTLIFLERSGCRSLIMAGESFFAFLFEGKFQRLFSFGSHLFDFFRAFGLRSLRLAKKASTLVYHKTPAILLVLSYPLRKIYWFSEYQIQKRWAKKGAHQSRQEER